MGPGAEPGCAAGKPKVQARGLAFMRPASRGLRLGPQELHWALDELDEGSIALLGHQALKNQVLLA